MTIKFGTGGWRAVIADGFTFQNVRRLAMALSRLIKDTKPEVKPVVIGRDLRFLSERFAKSFAEVMANEGIRVWFVDEVVPTPAVMFAVEQENLDFGIMVTASHNPPEYNGIKVIVEKGKDAPVEVTDALEVILETIDNVPAPSTNFDELVRTDMIRYYSNKNQYIDALLSHVDVERVKARNLNILFNPMHGVAKDIMAICLASLRCSVDIINAKRDTMFGVKSPSPERAALQDMEYMMKAGRYDLGIATDGDSDRIGLYDELGNYVDANAILKLLYYYLKEYRGEPGGIVRNLTTTHVLDRIAAAYGEEAYEVPVGFKYISAKMEEKDLLLGGESSGGLKIRGHVNGKDGILPALLVVEMLSISGKSLSRFLDEIDARFGTLVFNMINLPVEADRRDDLNSLLLDDGYVPAFSKPVRHVSYMDGAKFYFDDGTWLSIRFSGTEPLLRIAVEANDEHDARRLLDAVSQDARLGLRGRPMAAV